MRWLRPFLVALAFGIAIAIGAEVALRVFWPDLFPRHIVGLHRPHPTLGHVLAPDRAIEIVRPEYAVRVRTNRDGFRGAELLKAKPALRIVCLGDWVTWSEGASESETYPVRLQNALRSAHPGRTIEVVNAGVPQYATVDELAYLESFADTLAPDIVVTEFYAGDDFEQNSVPAGQRYEFRNGELVQTAAFEAVAQPHWLSLLNAWKHRSHALHWISERAGALAMRAGLLADIEQASGTHFTPDAADLAQSLLADIQRVAARAGARTLFVFVPEKMQVLAAGEKPLRAARLVEAAANSTGAAFLDLTPRLRDPSISNRVYYDTVGTWRPHGYEIAAAAVYDALEGLGWIDEALAAAEPAAGARGE